MNSKNAFLNRTPALQQFPRIVAIGTAEPAELDHIVMPRTGLKLPRNLSFEKWLNIGQKLSALSTLSAWCLGDWLVYGQAAYSGRYRDAVEKTALDYQTLRNYAWVAGKFQSTRRRVTLSFGHHAEVAALPEPEQDFWLRKAEEFGWSRNKLRHEVRASLSQRAVLVEQAGIQRDDRGTDGHRIEVTLTAEQLDLYQEAASREGMTVDAWVAATLEKEVRNVLSLQGTGLSLVLR